MQKILFSLAVAFCFFNALPANGQEAPAQLIRAAQAGLHTFLGRISTAERSDYGFTRDDSFEQVYLGGPFNLHTIAPEALLNYAAGTPVHLILSKTALWYFPVMLGAEVRSILVVDRVDGEWQAVSLGYANLARGLAQVMQRWPRAKNYHPVLIAVFQAKQHLVWVPEENAQDLFPLVPGRKLAASRAADLIDRMKPTVRKSLQP